MSLPSPLSSWQTWYNPPPPVGRQVSKVPPAMRFGRKRVPGRLKEGRTTPWWPHQTEDYHPPGTAFWLGLGFVFLSSGFLSSFRVGCLCLLLLVFSICHWIFLRSPRPPPPRRTLKLLNRCVFAPCVRASRHLSSPTTCLCLYGGGGARRTLCAQSCKATDWENTIIL